MSKNKSNRWLVLVFIIILAGFIYSWWKSPLGPKLVLPSPTATRVSASGELRIIVTPAPISAPAVTSIQPTNIPSLTNPEATPTSSSQSQCGGSGVMTILLIGEDYRGARYLYGLADSIRVVRVDFTNAKTLMVDFPRDLWVEIPGIQDHYGITHGKLNEAYFFGNPGMGYYDGPDQGPGLLAQTLSLNFGVQVDHYLAVSMDTFVRAIDAVGGVDVYLEKSIDLNGPIGIPDPNLRLEAGLHHMDGELALAMVRNRFPSIFQRMRNQNAFIMALRDKLLSLPMLPRIPGLIARFIQSTQTDLSPEELNNLFCIAQQMTKDNFQVVAFPEDMFTAAHIYDTYRKVNTFVFQADFEQMRAMVADFSQGTWP
jgi:polyisoprenyl-teichoic acid--peptidoglycan teichoic acid transferase